VPKPLHVLISLWLCGRNAPVREPFTRKAEDLKKPLSVFLSSILPDPSDRSLPRGVLLFGRTFQRRHPQGTLPLKTLQDELKAFSNSGGEPVIGIIFAPAHLDKRFLFTGKPDPKKTYKRSRE
jgi:hypothetical protein